MYSGKKTVETGEAWSPVEQALLELVLSQDDAAETSSGVDRDAGLAVLVNKSGISRSRSRFKPRLRPRSRSVLRL